MKWKDTLSTIKWHLTEYIASRHSRTLLWHCGYNSGNKSGRSIIFCSREIMGCTMTASSDFRKGINYTVEALVMPIMQSLVQSMPP